MSHFEIEFKIEATDRLVLDCKPPLSEMYTLSPFVWPDGTRWESLIRAVPRRDDMPALKTSRIFHGVSDDGLHFTMAEEPCLAPGPDGQRLQKQGVRLPSTLQAANPTEATIVCAKDGTWRLFFKYAAGSASRIGVAAAAHIRGLWTVQTPLFEARAGRWDGWHLSTDPLLISDPERPIMFYNGATRDAHWRIG